MEGVAYTGIPSPEELAGCPGLPTPERRARGRVAVIECVQCIPCNPCTTACPFHAITIQGDITGLPHLNSELCTGCGRCVACCPGLAITLVDETYSDGEGTVDFPYEYWPLPAEGDAVDAVGRDGGVVCGGRVVRVLRPDAKDGTRVIRIAVPKEYLSQVKSIKRLKRERGA